MHRTQVKTVLLYAAYLLGALLLGVSIHVHFLTAFWGDQDWELLVARMWLDGKKLYIDHVPVTPPLLFYFYALPVAVSRVFPEVEDYQALVAITLVVIAGVILLSDHVIRQHGGFASTRLRIQFAALLCFLLVFHISSSFFADREHLMIVLSMPYLLRWMPGLDGKRFPLWLRLTIGAVAAPGFFLKPHCMLVFAAIQLVTIARTRTLRILRSPENLVIYGLGALYAVILWVFTPEYFTTVLPIAFYTYSALRSPHGGLVSVVLTVALAVVALRPRDRSAYRNDIYYIAALLPFYYLYVIANNGWPYTYLPLMTMALLLNGFALWEFASLHRAKTIGRVRYTVGTALCLLNFALKTMLVLQLCFLVYTHPCRGDRSCTDYYTPFLDVLKGTPEAHSFGVLGMDFQLWARVAKLSGAAWQTRYPQLWMMPKFLIAGDAFYTLHKDIYLYIAYTLAEDLNTKKPAILFAERAEKIYTIALKQPIDWVTAFSTVPVFKDAFSHYVFDRHIDNCTLLPPSTEVMTKHQKGERMTEIDCQYDVWRRKD
jgi:hypothetical protein